MCILHYGLERGRSAPSFAIARHRYFHRSATLQNQGWPCSARFVWNQPVSFLHLVAESLGKAIAGRLLANEEPKFPGAIVCGRGRPIARDRDASTTQQNLVSARTWGDYGRSEERFITSL